MENGFGPNKKASQQKLGDFLCPQKSPRNGGLVLFHLMLEKVGNGKFF